MTKRSNEQWISDLSGQKGKEAQTLALEDLSKYLTKVSLNSLYRLLDDDVLANELSTDFAQEALAQISEKEFYRLAQFRGEGNFTSWAATSCTRIILRAIQKPSFKSNNSADPDSEEKLERLLSSATLQTERIVLKQNFQDALERCLEMLSEPRRIALDTCLMDISADEAGARMGGKSANAVHSLSSRAKNDMRKCLEAAGYDRTVLTLFN